MIRAMAPTAATSDYHGDDGGWREDDAADGRSGRMIAGKKAVRAPPRAPQFFGREEIAPKMEIFPTANPGEI